MWSRTSRSALAQAAVALLAAVLAPACGSGEVETPPGSPLPRGRGVTTEDPASGTMTTVYEDGTVVVQSPDGSSTITTADGTVTFLDATGKVIDVVHEGTAKAGEGTDPNPDPLDSTTLPRGYARALSLLQNPEFNAAVSLAAFEETLYPVLRAHCSQCHSSETANRLPLHADASVVHAHQSALDYVNLRQVDTSRLISRLGVDDHNCWSDCGADARSIAAEIQRWADRLGPENLPALELPVYQGQVSEAHVQSLVERDREDVAATDRAYVRYASLHALHNRGATIDEMNTARAGLSKALNSTARYAPAIVNPVAVDDHSLVYRFDVRDYWGYKRSNDFGGSCLSGISNVGLAAPGSVVLAAECGQAIWERITRGNDSVSADDTEWEALGRPVNNTGFQRDYVEAAQLVYTLTRPSVYNEILQIPLLASTLEREAGVDNSLTYQFMTVNDAVTIGERLVWRAESTDGYYWKTVDQFSLVDFVFYERPAPVFTRERDKSQVITTPIVTNDDGSVSTPNRYSGAAGAQAQASEAIFSLPNGLQGYAIFGAGNQRRDDTFTFVELDPRRRGDFPGDPGGGSFYDFAGKRLLNGASCIACHSGGVNRSPDDMRPFIEANPRGSWTRTTDLATVEELYPGTAIMGPIIENDREFFSSAEQQIADAMIVGTSDKRLQYEPVLYLFEVAQLMYGYENTVSN